MKIICTLPNASELISGVKFISHKDGMISEDISQERADAFLEVPGYVLAGKAADEHEGGTAADKKAAKKAAADKAAAEQEAADAAAKAAAEAGGDAPAA